MQCRPSAGGGELALLSDGSAGNACQSNLPEQVAANGTQPSTLNPKAQTQPRPLKPTLAFCSRKSALKSSSSFAWSSACASCTTAHILAQCTAAVGRTTHWGNGALLPRVPDRHDGTRPATAHICARTCPHLSPPSTPPVHVGDRPGCCASVNHAPPTRVACASKRNMCARHSPTSAPGLGSPRPHLRLDSAGRAQICARTLLTTSTSAPGLGSPRPRLRRDSAQPVHISDWPHPAR